MIKQSLSECGVSITEIAAFSSLQEAQSFIDGVYEFACHLGYVPFHNERSSIGIREPLDLWVFYFTIESSKVDQVCK